MRIIFMGTPDFSVGTLEALVEAGHEVCLVVSQPDKPKGRGKEMQPTPVKEAAMKHGIPVYQPKKIRDPECAEELRKYNADVMVVIAFGQIIPKEILEMTPYGCINVHASLLPKYRGAAPIQWSIINGEEVTGVTTMQMNEGLDTGDMIQKVEVPITEDETGESLHDKLAEAGADMKIIVYLRRQDLLIQSYWAQQVKECMNTSFSDYIVSKKAKYFKLDYDKRLEEMAAAVGRENIIVRVYEKQQYYGGNIISDFLHLFDLEMTDEFKQSDHVVNASLEGACLEAKRLLNANPRFTTKLNFVVPMLTAIQQEKRGRIFHRKIFLRGGTSGVSGEVPGGQ